VDLITEERSMDVPMLPREADAVFEGGGVKGIAFAGAIAVAERSGVKEWKNVAGTSAGAIAACLLAAGYHAADLDRIMTVKYREFADYGRGGVARGLVNSMWMRGLAPGRFFAEWLERHLAESPLGKSLGDRKPTFADVARKDLPADLTNDERKQALYRLRVIASDVTAGRMLVLPHEIEGFSLTKNGPHLSPETLTLAQAVRMSMSFPFLYTPVTLWEGDRPHFIVDGGLLSNFPVWLFDSAGTRPPARPTWGFRVHGGTDLDEPTPNRPIRLPLWRLALARAMFQAASEAWDRDRAARAQTVRTVDIPTGRISTTDFNLSDDDAAFLRASGEESAQRFFASPSTQEYLVPFKAG
jgi:NTE family protein